jgi:nitrite reductase/ring-hydroxylating ferredoxin subunit
MVWHTVDISPDSPVSVVRLAGVDVLMIGTDGGWLAIEDRCSHADCSFSSDGEVDGSTVICNCHGSEFDLRTGEVLVPPAFDPIRTFPVRNTGGRLEVEL